MPKAYIVADVTVTDPEQMAKYREWSTRAMQEHGAEILVRGGAVEPLEGGWSPTRMVVLAFQSMQAARDFYFGETYAQARKLREGAGVMRMVLAEGAA